MAIIGVLYLTSIATPPSSSQTPTATIISHLSDLYPAQTHQPFNLDHRLFVSTFSLLPHVDTKREYTHFLTSSHTLGKTFVSTTNSSSPLVGNEDTNTNTSADSNGLNTITISTTTSLENFTGLISQKLQPQWSARQFVVLDKGASITLPIVDDAKWKISVGDIRLSQSRVSGPAAGQFRGVLIEVEYNIRTPDLKFNDDENKKNYETLFRSLLKNLFKTMKLDLRLDEAAIHLAEIPTSESLNADVDKEEKDEDKVKDQQKPKKPPGHEIAELYMEVLRGSRG